MGKTEQKHKETRQGNLYEQKIPLEVNLMIFVLPALIQSIKQELHFMLPSEFQYCHSSERII